MGCVGGSLLYFIKGNCCPSERFWCLNLIKIINGQFRCVECSKETKNILRFLSREKQSSTTRRKLRFVGRHVFVHRVHADLLQTEGWWEERSSSWFHHRRTIGNQRWCGCSIQASNDRRCNSNDHRDCGRSYVSDNGEEADGVLVRDDEVRACSYETNGVERRWQPLGSRLQYKTSIKHRCCLWWRRDCS